MNFELSRVHQRYLPLVGQRERLTDEQVAPPKRVVIEASARDVMKNALDVQACRGGPLFGQHEGEVLTVEFAALGGYSWRAAHDALHIEPHYLLGLVDAYRQTSPWTDWIGHWITLADGRLPSPQPTLAWYQDALSEQLVGPRHCLVFAGWADSALSATACLTNETTHEPEWLEATI